MKLKEFLEKYNGKFIDFDGAWGNQCFDLFHQYVVEVLGITDGRVLAAPAAKDIFNNFDNLYGHENFERIPNTPTGVPLEGDIVIFGSGTYGHVCIFIDGNVNKFNSFDQNYPTGSPCHVQSHTYSGCLGWLRYKGSLPQEDLQKILDQVRKERDENNNKYEAEKAKRIGLEKQVGDYKQSIEEIAKQLDCSPDTAEIKGRIEELLGVEDRANQAEKKVADLSERVENLKNTIKIREEDLRKNQELYQETAKELSACESVAKSLAEAKEKVEGEVFELQQDLIEKEQEIERLKTAKDLEKYETKELIAEVLKRWLPSFKKNG